METRRNFIIAIALAILLGLAASVSAQVIYGQPTAGSIEFIYNSWSTEVDGTKTTLSQVLTPVMGFVPVRENFDLSLFMASSSNSVDADETEYTLNGLSDLRIQARHSFANDRLLAAVGINLPTGKRALSLDEEWLVLQELSTNYYELPLRRLGEGLGFSLLFGGATMLSETVKLGGGVSYQLIGGYEPYEGYTDYNPGDVMSINGRTEIERGDWSWTADCVYSLYTKDQVDGIETFRQSPQLDMRLLMSRDGTTVDFGGMLRYVVRGDNELFDSSGSELATLQLYGNELNLAGSLSWSLAEGWSVAPNADLRVIGSNDTQFDHSTIFGVGAMAGRNLTKHLTLEGGLKFYTGTATTLDALDSETEIDADVSGFQLTLGLSAAL